jgi:teichuronic acid biosynthesis glycosyltransferase TuaC
MEKKLKVLFVSSGNSANFEIAPFIKAQGESLAEAGVAVSYFTLIGKGLTGYLKGARKLRNHLSNNSYDIIHAHYILSGWSAVLALPRQPIVLSLMGTDAYGDFVGVDKVRFSSKYLIWLTKLIQPFVTRLVCKSEHIQSYVYLKQKSVVIPNGILLDKFIVNPVGFRTELGLDPQKKYILFLGATDNVRKNFTLAKEAFKLLSDPEAEMITPFPLAHDQVIKYLNSVDCLVAPSLMEGSPNVVKEAMACNCPVVATDVGDVKWLFGNEPGYYISGFNPSDFVSNIRKALQFAEKNGRTKGRDRIIVLGLDSKVIAQRIIALYDGILKASQN